MFERQNIKYLAGDVVEFKSCDIGILLSMDTEHKNYVNVQWLRRQDEIEDIPDRLPEFFGTQLGKAHGTKVHSKEIFFTGEITAHPTDNARNKVNVIFANIHNGQGLEETTLTGDQLLLRYHYDPGRNSFSSFPENLATISRKQTEPTNEGF
jgi:hypothetical protein